MMREQEGGKWLTNNLPLNANKTKEMTVDPQKTREQAAPLQLGETDMERTGAHINEDIA